MIESKRILIVININLCINSVSRILLLLLLTKVVFPFMRYDTSSNAQILIKIAWKMRKNDGLAIEQEAAGKLQINV